MFYFPDPVLSVVSYCVQFALVDYDRMFVILIPVDVYSGHIDVLDNDCTRPPTSVAIIWLIRGQGHPTYVAARMYPGYSSRVPGKSDGLVIWRRARLVQGR